MIILQFQRMICEKQNHYLTIDAVICDVNGVYVMPFLPPTRLIEHMTTEAAVLTTVTSHNLVIIRELLTCYILDKIALVLLPCYIPTVPDCS